MGLEERAPDAIRLAVHGDDREIFDGHRVAHGFTQAVVRDAEPILRLERQGGIVCVGARRTRGGVRSFDEAGRYRKVEYRSRNVHAVQGATGQGALASARVGAARWSRGRGKVDAESRV